MNIVNKKLVDIHPYEKNPRFNEDIIDTVANSIKEFGFRCLIVVDKDHVIICGYTRLSAAKKLGLEKVPVHIADNLTPEQVQEATASAASAPERASAYNPKLLLVDDVALNLKVLKAMLKRLGIHDIITTTSASEALEILKKEPVDIVCTDMWMPEINGQELAHKIREELNSPKVKIVAVTADAEFKNTAHDFDAVLLKPVTQDSLRTLLHGLLTAS